MSVKVDTVCFETAHIGQAAVIELATPEIAE